MTGFAEIFGTCADDQAGSSNRSGDQRRCGKSADANGKVETFFEQVNDPVDHFQIESHGPVNLCEGVHEWRHVPSTEFDGCRQSEQAAGVLAARIEVVLDFLELGEDAAAPGQELRSFFRER